MHNIKEKRASYCSIPLPLDALSIKCSNLIFHGKRKGALKVKESTDTINGDMCPIIIHKRRLLTFSIGLKWDTFGPHLREEEMDDSKVGIFLGQF